MANAEIRDLIFKYRLRHYEVARQLRISECTLSRWLRTELPTAKKKEILEAIYKLVRENSLGGFINGKGKEAYTER